jgi:protein-S-isoprenylcysteine O-methyltransferase Ste14
VSSSAQKKHYDLEKKNKAVTGFGFRALIAGYLVYLAWQLAVASLKKESPVPPAAVAVVCILFVGAAAAFVYYAWRQFQRAMKEAECTEEEMQAELDTSAHE